MTGTNLVTKKVKKIDVVKHKVEMVEKTYTVVVSKNYPVLEIIDPETFQSVQVENPINVRKSKVKVIKVKEKIYLIS